MRNGGKANGRSKVKLPIMVLEPRMMFDGAAVVDITHAHAAPDAAAKALIPTVPAPLQVQASTPGRDGGKTEAVFVDSSVSNWQALVSSLEKNQPGVEIDLIDGGQSGLAQIATWAESHSDFDAIHILSQGSEATLAIGTDTLTDASLASPTTQVELAAIGSALKAGGEIALYGSNIGAGADGQQFIADLANESGAVVAASDRAVGDPSQGGSWTLDTSTGTAGVSPLAIAGYLGTLDIGVRITDTAPAPVEVQAANAGLDGGLLEVAFVDTSVVGWETLVTGIQASRPGIEIELIDGTQSGLAQMTAWAGTHSGYSAIHLLSHGTAGQVDIGTDAMTDALLSTSSVQADLTAIGSALKPGGDLLLYGCDVAAGAGGEQLITDLATDTGAVVAASTDATGASSLGANWVLERSTAAVDVAALAISSYDGELAAGTTLVTGGNTTTTYQDVSEGLVLLSNGGKAVAYLNQANGDLVTYSPYGPLFDGVILVMDANNNVVKTIDFKAGSYISSASNYINDMSLVALGNGGFAVGWTESDAGQTTYSVHCDVFNIPRLCRMPKRRLRVDS